MLMTSARSASQADRGTGGYTAPTQIRSVRLRDMLQSAKRTSEWDGDQINVFLSAGLDPAMPLFSAGDPALLSRPCVSIVGSRNATPDGRARASRLSRELVERGIVVISGLARGIDSAAHLSALESGG